jgi:hypothetical protein
MFTFLSSAESIHFYKSFDLLEEKSFHSQKGHFKIFEHKTLVVCRKKWLTLCENAFFKIGLDIKFWASKILKT